MIPKTKNPFVDPDYGKPSPPESVYYAEVFAVARADFHQASAIRFQTKLSGCRWIPICMDGYSHEYYVRDLQSWGWNMKNPETFAEFLNG
jgi:hypothetical protein